MKKLLSILISLAHFTLLLHSQNTIAQPAQDLIKHQFKYFQYDNKNYLSIHLKLEKGWHIYWKNPGDSGIATDWNWSTKNPATVIEMLEWPTPTLFKEAGDLWTFGYSGSPTFFASITSALTKESKISLTSSFLVCKEICLPAKFHFDFDVKGEKIIIPNEVMHSESDSNLINLLSSLPKNKTLPANFSWDLYHLEKSPKLRLVIQVPTQIDLEKDSHLLTPFPSQPLNFRHYTFSGSKFIQEIDWDGQYMDPPLELPSNGKFATPYKVAALIRHEPNKDNGVNVSEFEFTHFKTINEVEWNKLTQKTPSDVSVSSTSLLLMILFAFLGGIILNFMPCVLPVISIKLYSLIHHSKKSSNEIIKHHGSYTLGVIFSFWALALLITTLKKSGESIGWGFQLQSPSFVWFMILLFFFLSLNLFGLFEFKTPLGNTLGKIRSHNPYVDDFLSGLLAVIVATPCSAPFLGSALTYAFSEETYKIFLLFTFMGIGLSFPFIVTALYPKSLIMLPRPGKWMEQFKYLMGLALLISVLWLLEVLQHLGNFSQVSFQLYFTLILCFFSLFLYKQCGKATPLVLFLISFTLFNIYRSFPLLKNQFIEIEGQVTNKVDWAPWNEVEINNLLRDEKLFFVDATAKWCITCQVNKKLVMDTNDFYNLAQKYNATLIRLDWTKKDPEMFNWIQNNGAVSVPAYFVGYKGKIYFIGETLSLSKIENAFKNPSSN